MRPSQEGSCSPAVGVRGWQTSLGFTLSHKHSRWGFSNVLCKGAGGKYILLWGSCCLVVTIRLCCYSGKTAIDNYVKKWSDCSNKTLFTNRLVDWICLSLLASTPSYWSKKMFADVNMTPSVNFLSSEHFSGNSPDSVLSPTVLGGGQGKSSV